MKGATLYAIYDTLAEEYVGQILTARADAVAVRIFSDIANSKDTTIGQHPADFNLVALATIDQDNNLYGSPRTVITGEAWLAAQNPEATLKLEKEA